MKNLKKMLGIEANKLIEDKIAQFEKNTGCELVIAVAKESDPYPAAPLRFAFLSTIIISIIVTYFLSFHMDTILVLGQLVLFILLAKLGNLRVLKNLVLVEQEVQREVSEKSVELFHTLCTTKTQHKVSTFIYFSMFEKQIRLLVDEDLNQKVSQTELDEIVGELSMEFSKKNFANGITHAIDKVEGLILTKFEGKLDQIAPEEIKNEIHWIN